MLTPMLRLVASKSQAINNQLSPFVVIPCKQMRHTFFHREFPTRSVDRNAFEIIRVSQAYKVIDPRVVDMPKPSNNRCYASLQNIRTYRAYRVYSLTEDFQRIAHNLVTQNHIDSLEVLSTAGGMQSQHGRHSRASSGHRCRHQARDDGWPQRQHCH